MRSAQAPKVAYIMSRFPKLTETFVLYEALAVQQQGIQVEIYPLLRENQRVTHPEARKMAERARFAPFVSLPILDSQRFFLKRQPRQYMKLWQEVLSGTWGSLNFLVGGIGILPKSVHFARSMLEQGVTHVHAHFASHPALAALIIHRLTGIPFSFTAHGSDLHVERRMLDRKVQAASFVVAISSFNKEVIVRECGEQYRAKIEVIHCGIDPDIFVPSNDRPRGSRFRMICVASFEEVKGHRYLIEACRVLEQDGVDFECHLVGDGPCRPQLEKQVRDSRLDSRVCVHGAVSRDRVVDLLKLADVFVLPSVPTKGGKREGIPVVLMEAMATGLPVVSSMLSGIPELVESGVSGLLTASGDIPAIAVALDRLYRDPKLRAQLGSAGRERVLQQFNQRLSAERLVRLFSDSSGYGSVPPATTSMTAPAADARTVFR